MVVCEEDCRFADGIIIKGDGKVGKHTSIDHGFYCTVPFSIGDYVHISPYCTIIGGRNAYFEMDHFSGLACGVRIICCGDELMGEGLSNPCVPEKYRDKLINQPVKIGKFAIIGTNAVISPGVSIGLGCVIGANSFVKEDTRPWGIYAGSPAKLIKIRKQENILKYAQELGYNTN